MQKRIESDTCDLLRAQFKLGRTITALNAEIICGIDVRNAREYLIALHAAGEVHIKAWLRDAKVGPWTPIYIWGCGRDAPKPRRKIRIYVSDLAESC